MKDKLFSLLRHAITAIPAAGAAMAANGWLTAEEGAKLDADLTTFLVSMAAILAGVLTRWLMAFVGKHAPHLSNVFGGSSGGASIVAIAATLGIVLAGGSLTSCAGLDGYDIDGQVAFIAADGAKGGLRFKKGEPTKGFLRVQTVDPETGKPVGFADIEIAKKAKVVPEK